MLLRGFWICESFVMCYNLYVLNSCCDCFAFSSHFPSFPPLFPVLSLRYCCCLHCFLRLATNVLSPSLSRGMPVCCRGDGSKTFLGMDCPVRLQHGWFWSRVQPGPSTGQPWQSALGAQGSHAQPARLSSPDPLVFDRWFDLWLLLLCRALWEVKGGDCLMLLLSLLLD